MRTEKVFKYCKSIFLILMIIFSTISSTFSSKAQAFENLTLGLGTSLRTETAADKANYHTFQNYSFFVQMPVFDDHWIYQLEYHLLKKESREGILDVEYKRHEIQNWGLWKVNPNGKTIWLTGLGASVNQENVTSKLVGAKTSRTTGDPFVSAGIQLAILRNFFEVIMAQVSLQYLFPLEREERETEGIITFRLGYNF